VEISETPFFRELSERKVFHALAVYAGSGWLCIEILLLMEHKYSWSPLLVEPLMMIIFCGLPAVLVYTWFHSKLSSKQNRKIEIPLYAVNVLIAGYLVIHAVSTSQRDVTKKPVEREITSSSIAVLPFATIGSVSESRDFAEGVAISIRSHLGKIGNLKVISGNSVEYFRDTTVFMPVISEMVGAKYVLEGSVQGQRDIIRIVVTLYDGMAEEQVWTETYDKEYKDLLTVQSEIAWEVANELNITINPGVRERITKKTTSSLEAYKWYLKGQQVMFSGKTTEDIQDSAIHFFEKAIALSPDFASAYTGLARAWQEKVNWGNAASKEVIPKVLEHVKEAAKIDHESGDVYLMLSMVGFYQLDFQEAEKNVLRAIELDPNNTEPYYWLANIYCMTRGFDEGLKVIEKLDELNPLAYDKNKANRASLYYYSGSYDEVLKLAEGAPKGFIQWIKACTLVELGRYEEAINTFSTFTKSNWMLGYAYGKAGRTEEARAILERLLEERKREYVPPYMIAVNYLGLGEIDEAFKWLELGLEEGPVYTYIMAMRSGNILGVIEDDNRFIALLEKFGFERI